MTGHVPITNISSQLTSILEKQNDSDEEMEDGDEETSKKDTMPNLSDLFQIGQFLKTTVVATTSPYGGASEKRHVELTIDPSVVNADINKEDYVPGMAVQGSVSSIEDHGIIIDIGAGSSNLSAFLSNKELKTATGVSISKAHVGQVLFLTIVSVSGNGRTLTLTCNPLAQKVPLLTTVESIKAVTAGVLVDATIAEVRPNGIVVNVYEHATGTIPLIHIPDHKTSSNSEEDKKEKFILGDRIKARVVATLPHIDNGYHLSLSILPHILGLKSAFAPENSSSKPETDPLEALPIGHIIDNSKVVEVDLNRGVFADVHYNGLQGYAHISKLSDENRPNALGPSLGPFRIDSVHRARIIDFCYIDNLYKISFQESVLKKEFLSVAEIPVGATTTVTVSNILTSGDIVVTLADGIKGFVPAIYVSDIKLNFPEKKYKVGSKVKARVLSVDIEKNRVKLTFKKTYLDKNSSKDTVIKDYVGTKVGTKAISTVTSIKPAGVIVEFFGNTRAFIRRSEISEAFVSNPKDYFRLGQTVTVRILEVDQEQERMLASCRTYAASSGDSEKAAKYFATLEAGKSIVSGTVSEKSVDSVILDIETDEKDVIIHGILSFAQLADDASEEKKRAIFKKIQAGSRMTDLLVLEKHDQKTRVILTAKPSLLKTAEEIIKATNGEQGLPSDLSQVSIGQKLHGFVSNVTATGGVFVTFANRLTALAPKGELFDSNTFITDPTPYFKKYSSVSCTVISVDIAANRFNVSFKETPGSRIKEEESKEDESLMLQRPALNPVDSAIKNLTDYKVGRLTKARILGVTSTHVNLELADNQLGRIDISEIYDSFDDIRNPKTPLDKFIEGDEISVRVIGTFNARSAKALAVTRPDAVTIVMECTCKPSLTTENEKTIIKMEGSEAVNGRVTGAVAYSQKALNKIEVGSVHTAFVHHLEDDIVFVNITPTLTGNISAVDMSSDINIVKNLHKEFPEGSALKVSVLKKIEAKPTESTDSKSTKPGSNSAARNALVLSSRVDTPLLNVIDDSLTGLVTPAEIIKKSTGSSLRLTVRISGVLVATLHHTDIVDDYSLLDAALEKLEVGTFIEVKIVEVDVPNQKIFVSSRPSLLKDSKKTKVVNKYIPNFGSLESGETIEGFVSNIANSGIFVELGHSVSARVQIRNISDAFLPDWKRGFVVKQKVKAVVLSVDAKSGKADISFKKSHLEGEGLDKALNSNLKSFSDIKVGEVYDGRVKRIQEYGIFVTLAGTRNVDGLCHISEIADVPVTNIEKLFQSGDKVKAKILAVDEKKKRLSIGLKASYFEDDSEEEEEDDDDDKDFVDSDGDINMEGFDSDEDEEEEEEEENDSDEEIAESSDEENEESYDPASLEGLAAGSGLSASFDWTASLLDHPGDNADGSDVEDDSDAESDDGTNGRKKARRNRKRINVNIEDKTAELATRAPQSAADYERMLVAKPNSSVVWISYMAFQLQLSEVEKARDIAQRALKTIAFREEKEKLNVWIALLNMEASFGTPNTVKEAFKEALQFMDSKTIYLKMASIYQTSGQIEEAAQIMKDCCKKLAKEDSSLWGSYGELFYKEASKAKSTKTEAEYQSLLDRARAVLDKAQQQLNQMIKDKYKTAAKALADVIGKFAKLEYQYGEPERGSSLFEGLLSSYRKRIDLWAIYIDYEIKYTVAPAAADEEAVTSRRTKATTDEKKRIKNVALEKRKAVEGLFERLVGSSAAVENGPKLSMKQAKFLFNKWLSFEDKYGDSKATEYVKARAADYVSKHLAAKEASKVHADRDVDEDSDEDSDDDDEEEEEEEDSE